MSIFSHFEKVAGPFPGEANGVIWDGDGVLFSLKDDSRLMHFNPSSREVKEVRKYTNRVNGIARGPQGQLYGAQEGGRSQEGEGGRERQRERCCERPRQHCSVS